MGDKTRWEQKGYEDAKAGKPPVPPTETKTSEGEKLGLALGGLFTGGLTWLISAQNASDDRQKTEQADDQYAKGYKDGIKAYNDRKEIEEAYKNRK